MTTTDQDWTVARMTDIPQCDICNAAPAAVDAPVKAPGNPWGYLCVSCWHLEGRWPNRLGCGIGQRLEKAE